MSGPNSDLPNPAVSLNLAAAHAAANPVEDSLEEANEVIHSCPLAGPAWNASAMFFGTMAWIMVYWAGPLFAKIDDDRVIGYILHCIAMGTIANLAVLPLVKRNHLSRGETAAKANAEIKKYFILCTIPDVLYEPVADGLAAAFNQESVNGINFKKYANPNFTPGEMSVAFLLFGVGFGLIYYGGTRLIHKLSPDAKDDKNENINEADEDNNEHANNVAQEQVIHASAMLRILHDFREAYESELSSAGIAAIQYFIFYLTDYLFDVDWDSFEVTVPQVLGMCALMAAYTFVTDAVPVCLHRVEDKMTIELIEDYKSPPIVIPRANSARFFQIRVDEAKRDTGDTQEILDPLMNGLSLKLLKKFRTGRIQ